MRKFLFGFLAMAMLFSCIPANAMSLDEHASLWKTGYVLVENGEPRSITAEEYERLMNTEVVDDPCINTAMIDSTLPNDDTHSYIPTYSYQYVNLTSTKKYLNTTYRVSPIFVSADFNSINVTETCTVTATVTKSAGLALTSAIKSAILSGGTLTFGYSTSESSATGTSVGGSFPPKTGYTYSAVVFQPRVHVVTGDVNYYQTYQGTQDLLATYKNVESQYPVTSSRGWLDGIYSVKGADSPNDFPDIQ